MPKFPMYLVNETVPLVLKLNPNPNSISMQRDKVFTQTQTLGGWVFEHWGEKPRTLSVTGRTKPILNGNLLSMGEHTHMGVEYALFVMQQLYNLDKRKLLDYQNLLKPGSRATQKIFSGDVESLRKLSNTFIYYKFDLYNGFFSNFSYEQSGEDSPRHYEYSFDFIVTSTLQNAVVDSIFSGSAAGLGTAAGLAQIGASGDVGPAAALLAGGFAIKKIGGLNV